MLHVLSQFARVCADVIGGGGVFVPTCLLLFSLDV